MTSKNSELEKLLSESWNEVLANFNHPLLHNSPELAEHLPVCDTAHFDFKTNKVRISKAFLEVLKKSGLDYKTALKGILTHEVAHYMDRPRDLATLLFLSHLAEKTFGKKHGMIVNLFEDLQVNLNRMAYAEAGKELRQTYQLVEKLAEESKLENLMAAVYQRHIKEDFGQAVLLAKRTEMSEAGKFDPKNPLKFEGVEALAEKLNSLLKVDYSMRQMHSEWMSLYSFGEIVSDLIADNKMPAMGGFELGDFSNGQIEKALDELSRKISKGLFEEVKKYVEKSRDKKFENKRKEKIAVAGLDHADIERNDDQIPYYERRARTYGLYIVKKPLIVAKDDFFPEENIEFAVGDPINKWNRFSAGGIMLPGISTKRKDKPMQHKELTFKVPDLFICLDTSGSMEHPAKFSNAVLAGFVLARNYHGNGSKVGVMNFSEDAAFQLPTRDLDKVYAMLCAYWGGGTVLDINKIREYFMNVHRAGAKDAYKTTEKDYKQLVERLSDDERRRLSSKQEITIKTGEKFACQKLDNIMLTDGGIANLDEVIAYFNQLGKITRNTIFIIGNEDYAKGWRDANLPNTQIITVETPKDLEHIAIGRVKKLAPAPTTPKSEFYR